MEFSEYTEDQIFDLLLAKKKVFMPWYTDESLTDGGVGILRTLAHLAYLQLKWTQTCAKESYLPTAERAASVFNIADTLSYQLSPAKAARILLTFTASGAATVPKGTKVRRPPSEGVDEVIFETDEALVFAVAGDKEVYGTQGETYTETFTSTGVASQSFELARSPYVYGSMNVTVAGLDKVWSEQPDFLESEADDPHFVIDIDADDVVTVLFGDGFNGAIPPSGYTVSIEYGIGGGEVGNVGKGTVTEMLVSIPGISAVTNGPVTETELTADVVAGATVLPVKDTDGFMSSGASYVEGDQFSYTGKTPLTFTGVTGLSDGHLTDANVWLAPLGNRGVDKETVDQAKWRIPAWLRTLRRAVSLADYERIVLTEFKYELAQARAYEKGGMVLVSILPTSGGSPSSDLITRVQTFVRKHKMARENVIIGAPKFVYIDCTVRVKLMEFYVFADLQEPIEDQIYNFLDPVYRTAENEYVNNWARSIYRSQIIRQILSMEGLKDVEVTVLKRSTVASGCADIVITDKEIVAPGVITVLLAGPSPAWALPIPAGARAYSIGG